MFETSLVRARAIGSGHRYRFLTLSVAVHTCAIAAVIAASVASTRLPTDAPRQMEIPILMRPVSLPPARGTPDAKPAPPKPQAVRRVPAAPAVVTAPQAIPDQVPVTAPADLTPASAVGDETSTGGAGRIGQPWGDPNSTSTDISGTATVTAPGPLRVVGDVRPPVVLHRVLPEYPRVAVFGRINGWVIVECVIDKTGHIRDARVLKSSFAAFEDPALDAVREWVFSPGTLHGEPVDTIFDLTVQFQVR